MLCEEERALMFNIHDKNEECFIKKSKILPNSAMTSIALMVFVL